MKRVTTRTLPEQKLSPDEVSAYLETHPQFFDDRYDLLEIMTVPHHCGEAVSLVTKQMELLRAKNRQLTRQLDDLLRIARDNDGLHQRVHRLMLGLLDATSVEDLLASLEWGMHHYFQADFIAVRIVAPRVDTPVTNLIVPASSAARDWYEAVIESEMPLCGEPDQAHARLLFGQETDALKSQAVIGLRHAGLRGVLGIGSRQTERFSADLGYEFLRQLSEVLASRLCALLNGQPGQ